MALKFNTFRAQRYLRSKFVEGKFLLASEATDLELEILDLMRQQAKELFGESVAVEDAWKVERLSATQLLIKPGEAWINGLPMVMRGGKDHLVSGTTLSIGTVPVGVSVADDASGEGKVLTFGTIGTPNPGDGETTPVGNYRIVITAKEELITEIQDPFLKNVNLSESTQQKVRVVFQLNIVPESIQTESPVPYRDENSVGTDAGLTPTNFPDTGNDNQPNFVNKIVVFPAVGVGELLSTNTISGSEGIDGKDLELIIANPIGNNPIPNSPSTQAAFSNGTLIDSNGTKYHINFITNGAVGGQVKIVIDKAYQQPNPVIDAAGGRPYTLLKRDVYVTDDVNGVPQGKLHWPIATINWSASNGLVHSSSITDLRKVVKRQQDWQDTLSNKLDLFLVGGGDVSWDASTSLLNWSSALKLINPYTPVQTVAAASIPVVDGGSVIYEMDLTTGGAIGRGTLAVSSTSTGTSITLTGSPDLSDVRVGNVVVDDNGNVAAITAINDVTDVITVNASLTFTANGTIYLDSYAAQTAPKDITNFVLAVRDGSKVYLGINDLELEDGEINQLGDGASSQLLTYIGSTGETDSDPNYTSTNDVVQGSSLTTAISRLDQTSGNMQSYTGAVDGDDVDPNYTSTTTITQGASLTQTISELDAGLDSVTTAVNDIQWKAPVANYAALPASGNVDGDVRLVLDTRVAYHWNGSSWLPLTGTGAGLKVVGGGTVSWQTGTGGGGLEISCNTAAGSGSGADLDIFFLAQTFTTTTAFDLDEISVKLANSAGTGLAVLEIWGMSGGQPDHSNVIATSTNSLDLSTLTGTFSVQTFSFSGENLAAATQYAIVLKNSGATTGTTSWEDCTGAPYAGGSYQFANNPGTNGTWTNNPTTDKWFEIYSLADPSSLTFSADMYLEKPGLAYTDNTIPISESPITLDNDKDVAYVTPNLLAGGPSLTVTVNTLDNVPPTAVVIARRDGSDVIVGSSSTRLKDGQTTELYAQTSIQTLGYIGAPNTADSIPAYSSDIRGSSGENLTARVGTLTNAAGDTQEDRSAYLRSDNPVTWTGADLQFTSDIVLEIINTKAGGISTHTIQTAASPIALANGESAYVSIDRTQASEILTVVLSGTTPIPAQSQANKDIVIIAKRQDVTGVGYLHLPLHKQVIEPGQSVRLGASGRGAGDDGEIFLNNNQVAPAAITDLSVDSTENKAFKVEYSIERFHQDAGGTEDVAFNTNLGTGFTWGFNDSIVLAMREQLDGKILIAGEYGTFNGNARNGLVRLNSDGTEDTAFYTNLGTGFSQPGIYGLAIQSDNKILVGGFFNSFNGNGRNRIVRLNSDGTEDTAFYTNLGAGPQGGNVVYSVTVQGDGKIIFAGDFTDFDTLGTQSINRRNSDGTEDATFSANIGLGANASIRPVAIQSDNKILVGGYFTHFNGNSRNALVRLNSDGTEDTAFYTNLGTGFNGVSDLVIQPDGKILVGGPFTSFNSNARNGLVRLNSDGTEDTSFYTNLGTGFSSPSPNAGVYDLAIQPDGKILVGGYFNSFNGNARNGLVRLNSDGTEDTAFYTNLGTGFNGPTNPGAFEILVKSDNKILAGGQFDDFNTTTFNALVSLNVDFTEERMTQGSFSGLYRASVGDWELGGFTSMGDASGVIFSIDSNGQVYYVSDDITSTLVESKLKYVITKL